MAKLQTTQPELYINDEDEMIVPQSEYCVKSFSLFVTQIDK